MTEPAAVAVRRHIIVDAPIERAFTVFTERFGDRNDQARPATDVQS